MTHVIEKLITRSNDLVIGNAHIDTSLITSPKTFTLPNINDTAVTTSAIQMLNNKTLIDPVISGPIFEDDVDNTKRAKLDLSKITGTNTYTLPASGTIVTTDGQQTLANKTLSSPIINSIQGASGSSIIVPVVNNDVFATVLSGQTFANKSFVQGGASTCIFVDATDNSRRAQLDLSKITGTNIYTLPASGTIVTTDGQQTLANKTLSSPIINSIQGASGSSIIVPVVNNDVFATVLSGQTFANKSFVQGGTSSCLFVDNTNNEKKARFDLSGLTAGTTIYTLPSNSGTILTSSGVTFTNSTFVQGGTASCVFSDSSNSAIQFKFDASSLPTGLNTISLGTSAVWNISKYALITHETSTGINGGVGANYGWGTRPLTNIYGTSTKVYGLIGNSFTLAVGNYYISCRAQCGKVENCRLRLTNITPGASGTVAMYGLSQYVSSDVCINITMEGYLSVQSISQFKVEQYCGSYASTNITAYGNAVGNSQIKELFLTLFITEV